MKLSAFRTRCKLKISSLKNTGLEDTDLNSLINEGVVQINLISKAYSGYTNFNIVANQSQYQLSTVAPTFQQILTAGLWVKHPTTLKLVRVIPRTKEWFNKRLPTWRDASSTTMPQYYYRDGDDLVIYPPMNAAQNSGGRLHHTFIPTDMPNDDSYPFTGTATEITAFRPLDNCIIEYVRGQIDPSLNKETGEDLSEGRLRRMVSLAMLQVKAKPDAINYYDVAMTPST